MGFMDAMKGANNSWATVTCKEGLGYLGPENLVDNRSHTLMISSGMFETIKFTAKDVLSVETLFATSEWIKYAITLKNKKRYIATFLVMTVNNKGKAINMGLQNFEWWLSDVLYKQSPVAVAQAVYSAPATPLANDNFSCEDNKTTAKDVIEFDEPSTEEDVEDDVKEFDEPSTEEDVEDLTEEEKDVKYFEALILVKDKKYTNARSVLREIKGHKKAGELLKLVDEIEGE